MSVDPWLCRWLAVLREHAADGPVLEIGCGSGADTETLIEAGFAVTGFDISPDAVARARERVPRANLTCQDVLRPFPLEGAGIGAVVASLSLHYFPWRDTLDLVHRIHGTLRPGGLFLCRLNSTADVHYGAVGHPRIADNFYRVDGEPKRFFDEATLELLFGRGWRTLSCEHQTTGKYAMPKSLWELALMRDG